MHLRTFFVDILTALFLILPNNYTVVECLYFPLICCTKQSWEHLLVTVVDTQHMASSGLTIGGEEGFLAFDILGFLGDIFDISDQSFYIFEIQ